MYKTKDSKSMTARKEVPQTGFDRNTGTGKVDIYFWSWSPENKE